MLMVRFIQGIDIEIILGWMVIKAGGTYSLVEDLFQLGRISCPKLHEKRWCCLHSVYLRRRKKGGPLFCKTKGNSG